MALDFIDDGPYHRLMVFFLITMRCLMPFCFLFVLSYTQQLQGVDPNVLFEIFGNMSQNNLDQKNQNIQQEQNTQGSNVPLVQDENAENNKTCMTETGEAGMCVQFFLCDNNNKIITDGSGVLNERLGDGPCHTYLEICCSLADTRRPNHTVISEPAPPEKPLVRPIVSSPVDDVEVNLNTEEADTSCKTEGGDVGECVQLHLCDSNNTIIIDGVGVVDLRLHGGPCESYLETCCLPAERKKRTDNSTTDRTLLERQGCGWRNPDGVGFRITGDCDGEANFGEFPWMVGILRREPVDPDDPKSQTLLVYIGGGSLIHPSVVLTAAHYVARYKNLRARVGEWDAQTTKEVYPHQDRDIAEINIHKSFNPNNLFYDIALLFLTNPVDMAPNVGLACLPPPDASAPASARCLASGWGKDKFGKEGNYQVIMKKVDLPVVDRDTCQKQLRRTRLGRFFQLHTSFMCAGGEPGRDTCKGDGGSPLVCPIESQPNRYQQYGIVAWGIKCGESGVPGVYVDVPKFRDWIDEAVTSRGYDPKVYTP